MEIKVVINMNYYQIISAMGKEAIKRKKAQGETMHLAPLGWKNVRINGKSTIRIDTDKFLLIQKAHHLRKRGKSIREICRIMNEQGLRSSRGGTIGPSSMFLLLNANTRLYRRSVSQ